LHFDFDINTIREGGIESFRPFFEKYTLILRRFALKYLPDADFVKDVVQDAMVRFWERRYRFDNMSSAISFLFVTTKNALFDEIRHKKVVDSFILNHIGGGNSNLEYYDEDAVVELYRRLESEVANLPHRTQEIIRLKLAGFQMKEIAEILGIGRETVKTLQRSGLEKLQKSMQPLCELYFSHQEELSL